MENVTPAQLKELAEERFADAKALFTAQRLKGAFYICGYAVEMALKHKICDTLGWDEYPGNSGPSAEKYKSFKTHKLDALLHLSGVEKQKKSFAAEWSIVVAWDPEIRYASKKMAPEEVALMINATETLLGILL